MPSVHEALRTGSASDIAALLDAAGAEEAKVLLRERDRRGFTPLHVAVATTRADVVEVLLAHKAPADAKDDGGFSPFHYTKDENIRGMLLSSLLKAAHGRFHEPNVQDIFTAALHADPQLVKKTVKGYTLLHLAALYDRSKVAELLIRHKADIEARDSQGKSPLHFAAFGGALAVAVLLVNAGADAGAADTVGGNTPLHLAALGGHADMTRMLIEAGSPVDPKDTRGRTPLHNASMEGHREVVELLLAEGASLDARTRDGRTPFDLATAADVRGALDRAAGQQRQGLVITRELTALLEHHAEDVQRAAREAAARAAAEAAAEAVRVQEDQLRHAARLAADDIKAQRGVGPGSVAATVEVVTAGLLRAHTDEVMQELASISEQSRALPEQVAAHVGALVASAAEQQRLEQRAAEQLTVALLESVHGCARDGAADAGMAAAAAEGAAAALAQLRTESERRHAAVVEGLSALLDQLRFAAEEAHRRAEAEEWRAEAEDRRHRALAERVAAQQAALEALAHGQWELMRLLGAQAEAQQGQRDVADRLAELVERQERILLRHEAAAAACESPLAAAAVAAAAGALASPSGRGGGSAHDSAFFRGRDLSPAACGDEEAMIGGCAAASGGSESAASAAIAAAAAGACGGKSGIEVHTPPNSAGSGARGLLGADAAGAGGGGGFGGYFSGPGTPPSSNCSGSAPRLARAVGRRPSSALDADAPQAGPGQPPSSAASSPRCPSPPALHPRQRSSTGGLLALLRGPPLAKGALPRLLRGVAVGLYVCAAAEELSVGGSIFTAAFL